MKIVRLNDDVVARVLAGVPGAVQDAMMTRDVVLAGGAIRDVIRCEPFKDVDVFCPSESVADELSTLLSCHTDRTVKRSTFSRTVLLGYPPMPVQCIFYRSFTSPAELIRQFDFLACCAAIYYHRKHGFVGITVEGFEEDALAKRLTFLRQPKDEGSLVPLKRALHFASKGWTLPDAGLTGILSHFEPALRPERVSRALRPSSYGGSR